MRHRECLLQFPNVNNMLSVLRRNRRTSSSLGTIAERLHHLNNRGYKILQNQFPVVELVCTMKSKYKSGVGLLLICPLLGKANCRKHSKMFISAFIA